MRITKTQLKRLIKEEYSSMSEGDETPTNVGQLLKQIETKMGTYLGTVDDIREVMTLISGLWGIIDNHEQNKTDWTDSEAKTTARKLAAAFLTQAQDIGKPEASPASPTVQPDL